MAGERALELLAEVEWRLSCAHDKVEGPGAKAVGMALKEVREAIALLSPPSAPPKEDPPDCATCDDHGWVGSTTLGTLRPCPDCAPKEAEGAALCLECAGTGTRTFGGGPCSKGCAGRTTP